MELTDALAAAAITAGRTSAASIGVPMNLAVLDAGAHLKAFIRMDGAVLGSLDIAIGKAKTAALFGMPSESVGEFCKPGGPSPGLELTNGVLVVFAGGLPVRTQGGLLIGALGVSGGSVDQDRRVSRDALEALQAYMRPNGLT
jgi:uncharacterized protein GlcG (DUF336 family)